MFINKNINKTFKHLQMFKNIALYNLSTILCINLYTKTCEHFKDFVYKCNILCIIIINNKIINKNVHNLNK